jgi:hypothetical protein
LRIIALEKSGQTQTNKEKDTTLKNKNKIQATTTNLQKLRVGWQAQMVRAASPLWFPLYFRKE